MFPIFYIGFIRTGIAELKPSDETLQQRRNLDHGMLHSPSPSRCHKPLEESLEQGRNQSWYAQ